MPDMFRKMPDVFGMAMLGFGPAGLEFFIKEARAGELSKRLRDGYVFIDKARSDSSVGDLHQNLIITNSTAADAIDLFLPDSSTTPEQRKLTQEDPIMEEIRKLPTFTFLKGLAEKGQHVKASSHQYQEFSEEVSKVIVQRIEECPQCAYYRITTISSMQLSKGVGSPFIIRGTGPGGEPFEVRARYTLISTAGVPKMPMYAATVNKKLRSSDYLQGERGMSEVKALLKAKSKVKVAITGGNHSAFSTAKWLLDALPDANIHINMLHGGAIRVYYDSEADAAAAGYAVQPGAVCAESGQVNRYGGIRSPGRELYQDVLAGSETRLSLMDAPNAIAKPLQFHSALAEADIIVPAFWFRFDIPKLLSANGTRIPWAIDEKDGRPVLNNKGQLSYVLRKQSQEDSKVVPERQVVLPNVFGAGLSFGLWIDHKLKTIEEEEVWDTMSDPGDTREEESPTEQSTPLAIHRRSRKGSPRRKLAASTFSSAPARGNSMQHDSLSGNSSRMSITQKTLAQEQAKARVEAAVKAVDVAQKSLASAIAAESELAREVAAMSREAGAKVDGQAQYYSKVGVMSVNSIAEINGGCNIRKSPWDAVFKNPLVGGEHASAQDAAH